MNLGDGVAYRFGNEIPGNPYRDDDTPAPIARDQFIEPDLKRILIFGFFVWHDDAIASNHHCFVLDSQALLGYRQVLAQGVDDAIRLEGLEVFAQALVQRVDLAGVFCELFTAPGLAQECDIGTLEAAPGPHLFDLVANCLHMLCKRYKQAVECCAAHASACFCGAGRWVHQGWIGQVDKRETKLVVAVECSAG